jgi:hypothetical protein
MINKINYFQLVFVVNACSVASTAFASNRHQPRFNRQSIDESQQKCEVYTELGSSNGILMQQQTVA